MGFLAIHGLGCHPKQGWPQVAKMLGEPIDAPLLIGAESTRAPPEQWGLQAQAKRLASLVTPDDVLIGHSMGGAIAVRIAAQATPRTLVLVEPHVVPSAGFVVRPALAAGPAPSAAVRADFLAKMATIDTGQGTYADWIAKWDWRVFHALSQELARGDGGSTSWLEDLAALDCPIHLLWGAESPRPDLHLDALTRMGIEPTWVDDAGHFIASERPDALADFLGQL